MVYAPRVYPEASIKGKRPDADEPTRTLKDGSVEVGAVDLKGSLTADLAKSADQSHRDFQMAKPQRNRFSGNNPHLNSPYSALEAVVIRTGTTQRLIITLTPQRYAASQTT